MNCHIENLRAEQLSGLINTLILLKNLVILKTSSHRADSTVKRNEYESDFGDLFVNLCYTSHACWLLRKKEMQRQGR